MYVCLLIVCFRATINGRKGLFLDIRKCCCKICVGLTIIVYKKIELNGIFI